MHQGELRKINKYKYTYNSKYIYNDMNKHKTYTNIRKYNYLQIN